MCSMALDAPSGPAAPLAVAYTLACSLKYSPPVSLLRTSMRMLDPVPAGRQHPEPRIVCMPPACHWTLEVQAKH